MRRILRGNLGFAAECLLLGVGVFALLLGVFAANGYAPFGPLSLALNDANFQYLDLFAYFKDVLAGSAHIPYSFTKVLGGNCIGIFAYYLASPFSLLVAFFSKADLTTFFDIAVALKLSLAAITFRVFLEGRFGSRDQTRALACLLSVAYALGQYGIAQAGNIMWLDGMYMLPLVMLGTTKVVRGKRSALLSIAVACTVLFNWYTGALNCLFSIMWLVAELLMGWADGSRKPTVRGVLLLGVRYGLAMVVGLLLACVLFVPTLKAMGTGGNSELGFGMLAHLGLTGNPLSILTHLSMGSVSDLGKVSLWCGSVALGGCVLSVLDPRSTRRVRIVRLAVVLAYALLYYFAFTDALFSLLKEVGSHWYRYSYGSIAAFAAIAGEFWLRERGDERQGYTRRELAVFGVALAGLAAATFAGAMATGDKGGTTPLSIAVGSVALLALPALLVLRPRGESGRLVLVVAAVLCVGEMAFGASVLSRHYSSDNVAYRTPYANGTQAQLAALRERDDGAYRVSETSTCMMRGGPRGSLRADYDEPMAYGYMSIMGYTSCPDDVALNFMDGLGYARADRTMCIVNDSLVAADSLLGVRYVISPYPITGMEEVAGIAQEGDRKVYANPYALPMALAYAPGKGVPAYDGNPFEHLNAVWSELLGREASLFVRVQATRAEGESNGVQTLSYTGAAPQGNYVLYGNVPWSSDNYADVTLNVNGSYDTRYSCWCSPSAFVIPVAQGQDGFVVSCAASEGQDLSLLGEGQFYALDLDALSSASAELRARAATVDAWEDGHMLLRATGNTGDHVLVSMPVEDNWEVRVNGSAVVPERLDGALVSVPLVAGDNTVELVYRAPGVTMGLACSAAGLAGMVLIGWFERRRLAGDRGGFADGGSKDAAAMDARDSGRTVFEENQR